MVMCSLIGSGCRARYGAFWFDAAAMLQRNEATAFELPIPSCRLEANYFKNAADTICSTVTEEAVVN